VFTATYFILKEALFYVNCAILASYTNLNKYYWFMYMSKKTVLGCDITTCLISTAQVESRSMIRMLRYLGSKLCIKAFGTAN
jgi:hypothetical protein